MLSTQQGRFLSPAQVVIVCILFYLISANAQDAGVCCCDILDQLNSLYPSCTNTTCPVDVSYFTGNENNFKAECYGTKAYGTLNFACLLNFDTTLIQVSNCDVSGTIPTYIGAFKNLTFLDLTGNKLTGSIPQQVGGLANLLSVQAALNSLSGPLPCFSAINLTFISFSVNQLTGTISDCFRNLTQLDTLSLRDNLLTGTIPSFIGSMTKLTLLQLFNNLFSGTIPPSFGQLTAIKTLNLQGNQLTGLIPIELYTITSLQILNLSGNDLIGVLPENLQNLTFLDVSNQTICQCPPNITSLKLTHDNTAWKCNNLELCPSSWICNATDCPEVCNSTSDPTKSAYCLGGKQVTQDLNSSDSTFTGGDYIIWNVVDITTTLKIVNGSLESRGNFYLNGDLTLIGSQLLIGGNFTSGLQSTITSVDSFSPIIIKGCANLQGSLELNFTNLTINTFALLNYSCHFGRYASITFKNQSSCTQIDSQYTPSALIIFVDNSGCTTTPNSMGLQTILQIVLGSFFGFILLLTILLFTVTPLRRRVMPHFRRKKLISPSVLNAPLPSKETAYRTTAHSTSHSDHINPQE